MIILFNGNGVWDSVTNQYDNPGMLVAEQTKYRKHEAQYAQTGYSFVAFVCSGFGVLGPSAIRIYGHWLCQISDNMRPFSRHMVWLLWMIVSVHNSGPIAIVPALLGLWLRLQSCG